MIRLTNGTVYTGEYLINTEVLINERIVSVGAAETADETVDLEGGYLVPGFIDVHTHGGFGYEAQRDEAALAAIASLLPQTGVTSFLPAVMTAPVQAMRTALRFIKNFRPKTGSAVLGAHLEGPFINPLFRGAHDDAFLLIPSVQAFEEIAGGAYPAIVTLSPELHGAMELIEHLNKRGVIVSLGHSDADAETVMATRLAGARGITHLYNRTPKKRGAHSITDAALESEFYCELICDGVHVPADTLRYTYNKCRGRVLSVTDAMPAAGMPDGDYSLSGTAVRVINGTARTHDGRLAGSTLTGINALKNLLNFGIPPQDALHSLTAAPAEYLSRPDLGRIQAGCTADLLVLDRLWNIKRVYIGGQRVV